MSLIIPANSLASGGFAVDNSARFNSGSSDSLTRTFSTPTSAKKFTISQWVKRTKIGESQILLNQSADYYYFVHNNVIDFETTTGRLKTNRLFRDTNAWYHIVIVVDTTLGTADDRIKMFINGVQETSFGSRTNPSLNANFANFNSATQHSIAKRQSASDMFLNGYLAEQVFLDGTSAAITDLGEFDEDSGIWKPIDVSSLTFGNNGFYLDFENSGNLGADASGESHNWTANNLTAIDQTTDTPTNNFATLNPLIQLTDATLSEGNLQVAYGSAGSRAVMLSNFGLSSGKWYCEFKVSASSASPCNGLLGIINGSDNSSMGTYLLQNNSVYQGAGYQFWDGNKNINQVGATFGATIAAGDIVGMAIDMDNKALYFSKNGTYQASGNPASGSSKTGAIDFSSLTDNGFWFIGVSDASGTQTMTYQCNFGNPPFTISSGNTDGNSKGNFEYAPPSGYYSLCTKNLSEYG